MVVAGWQAAEGSMIEYRAYAPDGIEVQGLEKCFAEDGLSGDST